MELDTETQVLTFEGKPIRHGPFPPLVDENCMCNEDMTFIYNQQKFIIAYLGLEHHVETGEERVKPRVICLDAKEIEGQSTIVLHELNNIWLYQLQQLKPSGQKKCITVILHKFNHPLYKSIFRRVTDDRGVLCSYLQTKCRFQHVIFDGGAFYSYQNYLEPTETDMAAKIAESVRGVEFNYY
jgi:hypothetical protein